MTVRGFALFGSILLTGLEIVVCLSFLNEPPETQSVLEGRPFTLECKTLPGFTVHWELKSEPLDISSRRFMIGTDLHIAKVLHDQDRGPFTCVLTDPLTGEQVSSREAYLDITWLSENVKVKTIGRIPTVSGEDLHLSCHVEGSEPIKIQWFKNGDGLQTSGKVNTTGYDLKVVNVNPLDNGVYRCVASNAAATVSSYNKVTLTLPGEQWAQIIVIPEDIIVKVGTDARFDCIYQYADVIEWYFKQTGPLENSTRYSLLPNGSLIVRSVTEHDQGLYSCVGIRGESTDIPQIFSASLTTAYLGEPNENTIVPLSEPQLKLVADGGDVEIGCYPPAGTPKPTVSWSRGSKGQVLSLRGVSKKDSGNYTCVITNVADTKHVSFHLAITTPPEIVQNPSPVMVDEGVDALFRCEFAGSHKYTRVQWFKDGAPVRGSRFIEKRGYLNITGALPTDQGAYICQILTQPFPPLFSSPAQLTVKEKLKFAPRPINTNLELGTPRKIHCRAQGAATPVIRWIKEGVDEGEFPEHVSDINGTLYFNKVQTGDEGKYTCIASNFQGIINATIDVAVVVSPKFTMLPNNPTEVYETASIMLDCVAEGDPTPTIHWDKNSSVDGFGNSSRFRLLENGSLWIEDIQISDEGKYGCTAGNSGGLKRYEVMLLVRGNEGFRISDSDVNSAIGSSMLSKTVAVSLGAAGAYMVLVVGLMAYCRCRSRKSKEAANDIQDPVLQAEEGHSGSDRKMCNGDTAHSDGDATAHSHQSHVSSSSRLYGKLAVTRDQLTDMMVLGRGQFGDVCLARIEGGEEGSESVVMVKALQETRDEAVLHEFKRELDLFGRLDHPNVVKLLGLCRQQHPHYMILQYTDWGDLKQMLLASKCDRNDKPKPPELTTKALMNLVRGLCLGMEHISNNRLVHRDLAARNCLVSSDLSVKISLSALSKDFYRKEYFLHRNKLLPIRWMPPEVVSEDDFSTKSDVFSFGVTAWEVFARGDLPHSGRSDQEVLSALSDTGGLALHFSDTPTGSSNPPTAFVGLVRECRSPSPNDRPAFSAIALRIADIISQLN